MFSRDSENHSQPLTFIFSGNLSQVISNFWELCKLPLEHVYALTTHSYKTKFSFALPYIPSYLIFQYILLPGSSLLRVSRGKPEYSIVATHGGLLIVACLVAKHRLQGTGLDCPTACGSSQTKLNTCPCTVWWILYPWTTRETSSYLLMRAGESISIDIRRLMYKLGKY